MTSRLRSSPFSSASRSASSPRILAYYRALRLRAGVTAALRQAKAIGCEIDLKHAIFFSARDAVVANPAHNVAGRARLLLPLTVPATASLARPVAYELSFVGSQRQTIMTEDRAAHLDLRTLKGRSHLYGIGPIAAAARPWRAATLPLRRMK